MVPEELGMYALIDSCDQPKISNMFLGVHMNSLQHPCCLMIEGDYIIKIYQTCFFDVRHKLYTGMIGFGIFSQSGVHVKSCETTTKPQVVGRLRETVLDGFLTYSISFGIDSSIRLIYIYIYMVNKPPIWEWCIAPRCDDWMVFQRHHRGASRTLSPRASSRPSRWV